jgi:hypothetical protein
MQMIVMIEVEQEFLAHWLGMTWISTLVGRADKDASGNRIDISMRSAMDRLRAWDLEHRHIHLHTEISDKHSASLKD